jgi:hypothetical protein
MAFFEHDSSIPQAPTPPERGPHDVDLGDGFGVSYDIADTTPVDESGFDEDAWMALLAAECASDSGSSITPTRSDLIDQFASVHKQLSRLRAQEQLLLFDLSRQARASAGAGSGREQEIAMRSLTAELAATVRLSDRTITSRINTADMLVADFQATVAALDLGEISWSHATTIADAGVTIDDAETRARYERIVLERAASSTPGRLNTFARVTAANVGKVSFQQRHDKAAEGRRILLTTLDDGMSQLTHVLPTVLGEAIFDRLTQQAKAVAHSDADAAADGDGGGDPRTYDQLRSDLATELLLTGQPSADEGAPHWPGVGIRAEVTITIPALSLLGVDTEPATLTGRGPIDLSTATRLAGEADHWVRVITHPVTGLVLAADTYRPSEQLKRLLRARDQRCRFPTCNRAASRGDIDHTVDWQYGGRTTPDNLACLCRGHHTLKQFGKWKVRQTAPGVLEWTSPTGRRITDVPDPRPTFTEQTLTGNQPPAPF